MENKNFDNLNDEELSELKDSLEETIQDRKRKRQAASKKAMGTKGLSNKIQLNMPPAWYLIISCMFNVPASIITTIKERPAGIS